MRLKLVLVVTPLFLTLMLTLSSGAFAASSQWAKVSYNPVLLPTPGSWDADYVTTPRVIFDGTTQNYRMWYQGGVSGVNRIGYATSTDGVSWVKHGIVLSPGVSGDWDSSSIGLGSVLRNGTTNYLMWYTGTNGVTYPGGAIGLAVSSDGVNWVKYSGNPVLKPSELFFNDQLYIATPDVIRLKLTYNMWYTAKGAATPNTNKILYATSFDGIHWTKWPSPVLSPPGNLTAWDSYGDYSASVIWNGQIFGMWYTGINQTGVSPRIGFATSPDGGTWTRTADNPILVPGPQGSWDSAGVEQPSVVQGKIPNTYMLFYDGYSSQEGQRIGLATSPPDFTIAEFPSTTVQLLLGIIGCSTVYMTRYRRTRKQN